MLNQFFFLLDFYFYFFIFLISLILYGLFFLNRSIIVLLMCIEMILLIISLNFSFDSIILDDFYGNIVTIFILGMAAAESVIGLGLTIIFYRVRSVISLNILNHLKG
jgi:NADH-quinone oxidoreductase subunit K